MAAVATFGWAPLSAASATALGLAVNQLDFSRHPELHAYVSVTDAERRPIAGLRETAFAVVVDGQPVPVSRLESVRSLREPMTVVLALDRSGSMRGEPIRQARAAAESLIKQLDERDHVGLVGFDDRVAVLAPPTREHGTAIEAVQAMGLGRDTAMNDAVLEAVKQAAPTRTRRKAVVLLTDGKENRSKAGLDEVIEAARRERVVVHTVGLGGQIDRRALRRLAEGTGGVALESRDPRSLVGLFEQIGGFLKNEYRVSFRAPGALDERWHELVVTVDVASLKGEVRLPYRMAAGTGGGRGRDGRQRVPSRLVIGIALGIVGAGAAGALITVTLWRRHHAAAR